MKLVYMGTPQFAVPPLRALVSAGYDIAAVVSRTDKPSGRGRALTAPPVKLAAQEAGLSVLQPRRVRDPEFIDLLRTIDPEAIVVAAYGQILPKEILTLPKFGCINIHASLLPAYRGAAPINWAIIRGERETGNTIMKMDEGMDTGDILSQEAIPIDPHDTAGTLTEKLARQGAQLITAALPLLASGNLLPKAQNHAQATKAPLLKKEDGLLNWSLSATELQNRVRGMSPWPGAYSFLEKRLVKIIESEAVPGNGEPGVLLERDNHTLDVGTGGGMLRIRVIQPEGKKPMTAADFLRGHRGAGGKNFEGGPR